MQIQYKYWPSKKLSILCDYPFKRISSLSYSTLIFVRVLVLLPTTYKNGQYTLSERAKVYIDNVNRS